MSKKIICAISSVAFFVPALLVLGVLHSLDIEQVLSVAEYSVMWMVFLVRLYTGVGFSVALYFVIAAACICGLFFRGLLRVSYLLCSKTTEMIQCNNH